MPSGEQSPFPAPENSKQSDLNEDPLDPGLAQLRDQVKKVMIPLLVKTFELKLAAQEVKTPPTRLQKQIGDPPEKIHKQLEKLGDDLKQLQLWCHSCQNQISKALNEIDESPESPLSHTASSGPGAQSAIEKSFSDAISSQAATFNSQNDSDQNKKIKHATQVCDAKSKQGWLTKWFFRQQKP